MWTKPLAYAACAATVLVVGSPIRENFKPPEEREDDFPLSYYPMFSQKRGRAASLHHLLGIGADGVEHILPHTLAGSGGLNQVRRQINRYVREERADKLARRVAHNVGRSVNPTYASVEKVQVVTSRHRYDDWFDGNKEPLRRRVRAEAPVRRNSRRLVG